MAFILSLLAGLGTGLGGCFVLLVKPHNLRFLAFALGFAAGVMVYLSFFEILREAYLCLETIFIPSYSLMVMIISFFSGVLLIVIIKQLVPVKTSFQGEELTKLKRMGLMTALALAIHNFPEGIITFFSSLQSLTLGIPIVLAVTLHNLPEGMAVAVPLYYATKSRWQALLYSLLSGLTEPLGALIGYFILAPFLNDLVFGLLFAMIAGIMVNLSCFELIPTARAHGSLLLVLGGLLSGVGFMWFSLGLFL